MRGNENFKKIRIFLSSPGDVSEERTCVKSVVEKLNHTGSLPDKKNVVLEVLDWNSHVRPGMGRPQEVILNQLPVEKWDLFVGIIWARFGTKSGGYNKKTGEEFESGTEEEFNLAYNSWKEKGRPDILFYRSTKMVDPLQIEPLQFGRVHNFFKKFDNSENNPGYYRAFDSLTDFERKFTQDIITYVETIEEQKTVEPPVEEEIIPEKQGDQKGYVPGQRVSTELNVGDIYEVAIIDIDVVGHTKLLKKYKEKKVGLLLDNLHEFVLGIVAKHNGDQFSTWAGDGGIFIFWGNEAFDNSVLAGLNILKESEVFNLNRKTNPIDEPIKLRIAGHCGLIEYQADHSKIHADCINDVVHIEKQCTNPGHFTLSDTLFKKIDNRIKETFKYAKNFENYSIYVHTSSPLKLSVEGLENFVNELKGDCYHLNESLKFPIQSQDSNFQLQSVKTFLEKIYINLDNFYYQFFDYDERWSPNFLQKLIDYLSTVIYEEENIYNQIQEIFKSSHAAINLNLVGLIQNAGILRANSIPNLKILIKQFENLLGDEKSPTELPKEVLIERIVNFIEADEFDEESALVELLVNEKERLIDYLLNETHDPMQERLLHRLWKLGDFVLLDDLAPPKLKITKTCRAIFPFAAEHPQLGKYFKAVIKFARLNEVIDKEKILDYLKQNRFELDKEDINIILKCLLVTVSQRNTRKGIIKSIDFNELWRLISYSKTPFYLIREITEHLYHLKDPEIMKIFFDLTFPRVIHEINHYNNETILHQIKMIILIFYNYDFFVEDSYFERLENLRLRFASESLKYKEIRLSIIDEFMEGLDKKRKERGRVTATIPKGINKLPLPIQRHLSREGHYLEYFILHRHHLIALETLRYININNIERLVRYLNRINMNLLRRIFEKNEIFKKNSVIAYILNSPRCNKPFALKHTFKLGKTELINIARNPNANTEVRNYIKTLIKNKFQVTIN